MIIGNTDNGKASITDPIAWGVEDFDRAVEMAAEDRSPEPKRVVEEKTQQPMAVIKNRRVLWTRIDE